MVPLSVRRSRCVRRTAWFMGRTETRGVGVVVAVRHAVDCAFWRGHGAMEKLHSMCVIAVSVTRTNCHFLDVTVCSSKYGVYSDVHRC